MVDSLKVLKEKKILSGELYNITSSLKTVASTQRVQFIKRANILHNIRSKFLETMQSANFVTSENTLHIVISCDQKFCKNFLLLLNKYLSEINVKDKDSLMVFGTRSFATAESLTKNIMKYKAISRFDECENIAVKIKDMGYPKVIIHTYLDSTKSFAGIEILKTQANNRSINKEEMDKLVHMYLSCEIYHYMLETGLKERSDRAMAMSEASDNAKDQIKELNRMYNRKRQSDITKEITATSYK